VQLAKKVRSMINNKAEKNLLVMIFNIPFYSKKGKYVNFCRGWESATRLNRIQTIDD
jgi:hypothetical protein